GDHHQQFNQGEAAARTRGWTANRTFTQRLRGREHPAPGRETHGEVVLSEKVDEGVIHFRNSAADSNVLQRPCLDPCHNGGWPWAYKCPTSSSLNARENSMNSSMHPVKKRTGYFSGYEATFQLPISASPMRRGVSSLKASRLTRRPST